MARIIRKLGLQALSVIFFLITTMVLSYAYVEPVRRLLTTTPPSELTNPDLPNRPGLKVGDITFHSAVSTGVQSDNNIYLSSQDGKYDLINHETGSFGLEIPIKEHKLSFDYLAEEYLYTHHDINDHLNQRARALIDLRFTDYRVTLTEVYRHYTEAPGSENSSRLRQDDNNLRLGVLHETDKFAFNVGYTNIVHHYFNDDQIFGPVTYRDRNSVMHIADTSVAYRFLPKTAVVLEDDYGISEHESADSPDYYFNDILLGLKGDLHKNLTTTFQAGYRYQYFKESPILFDKTASKFICRGGLKYTLQNNDIIDFVLERTVNDSTYQDITYYTTNFTGLSYTHAFTSKLMGQLFGKYQRNMYPTETTEGNKTATRRDNAYSTGFNLHYDIRRWLSTELGYEFKKADSNFQTFAYEDNIFTFKITAGF